MKSPWIIADEPVTGELTQHEGKLAMYLAGISLEAEPPEVPIIGQGGPKSREMTRSFIFHLHFTGRLAPKRKSIFGHCRAFFSRLWRRWEICCAPEPWPERTHRPSLFPPLQAQDDE